ncbi:sugar kinase [Paraferrimonas sp. SM1919]|uniref:sugar kinase n=1 Tax=Paraferrimonas sp. SM1919 TaxID=2662263 RepID=UPI0013D261CE|nr:sugar kinase [Paraferrimonas sp. SM1919]
MITDRKIVLIYRKTRLVELKEKYCTLGQAKFYLEHLGESIESYQDEHDRFEAVLKKLSNDFSKLARVQLLERSFLPTYKFSHDDLVVVVGQDGLVANTMKYLNGQAIVAVNPLPDLFDGVLLPFLASDANSILMELLMSTVKLSDITLAEVNTNLGQSLLSVNDIFIGPKSHTSARYKIAIDNSSEEQSSSGIIVSTGLGSTGWFKSILAGASGIAGRQVRSKLSNGFKWNSPYLYYSVREPFPSSVTSCKKIFGKVNKGKELILTSRMAENGVIFSDGIESDSIEFNAGTTAIIKVSSKVGLLVTG